MAVITTPIKQRSYELVRDRIGEILAEELSNQAILTGEELLNADVYVERVIRFDHTDLPAINIVLTRGSFAGQTVIQTDGTYSFRIEVYVKASSNDFNSGDKDSVLRLHRLLGVCQSIIEDARYKTLGYQTAFIMNRHFEEIVFSDIENFDNQSVARGMLNFSVRVPENWDLVTPIVLNEYKTQLTLQLTQKGYQFLKPVLQ